MGIADRILTIVVTATLTSAVWIVGGAGLIRTAREASMLDAPSEYPAGGARDATSDTDPVAGRTRDKRPALAPGGLYMPVSGIRPDQLSDTFTQSRGAGERIHEAIDIMAARGTPVLAAASGKIEKLFRSERGGNTIYIRSPDRRTIYYYAHLDGYAPNLVEGGTVSAGDLLGTVGITGNANPEGPHLHFAILQTTREAKWWEAAKAINPYPLLRGN